MRILWATLAVLAIIAMHGLATHASSHTSGPEPTSVAAATHAAHTSAPASAEPASHGEHGHEATVLGLCLAMLASAGILLLRVVRPSRGLLALLERAGLTPSYPVAVADGVPRPDLHALSILRC